MALREPSPGRIGEDRQTARWRLLDCPDVPIIYHRFIAAIRGKATAGPTFARGAELQCLLDAAEASAAQGSRSLSPLGRCIACTVSFPEDAWKTFARP